MRKTGRRLVIDGNAVYEIDVACTECKRKSRREYGDRRRRAAEDNFEEKKDIGQK